jgi:hypothetical protein
MDWLTHFGTLTEIMDFRFSADSADFANATSGSAICGNVASPRIDRPLWIKDRMRRAWEHPLPYRLFGELSGFPVHGVAWRAPAQPPPWPTFPFLTVPIKMLPLQAGALRSGAWASGRSIVRDGGSPWSSAKPGP